MRQNSASFTNSSFHRKSSIFEKVKDHLHQRQVKKARKKRSVHDWLVYENQIGPLEEDYAFDVAIDEVNFRLACAGSTGIISVWKLTTQKKIKSWRGHEEKAVCCVFNRQATSLFTGGAEHLIIEWDGSTFEKLRYLAGHDHWVRRLIVHPSQTKLISAGLDCTIKIWDLESNEIDVGLKGCVDIVTDIAYNERIKPIIVWSSWDRLAKVFDIEQGRHVLSFPGHTDYVLSCCIKPDATFVAAGGRDKTIHIWPLIHAPSHEKGWKLALNDDKVAIQIVLKGHKYGVTAVNWSPRDGNILISGSEDGSVKIWNIARRTEMAAFHDHLDAIVQMTISSNGQIIASTSKDATVVVRRIKVRIVPLLYLSHSQNCRLLSKLPYSLFRSLTNML
mmetsp:Transcript_13568/g.15033  ORF Transcript_13568/g.15033 Transcript_13568/m.15033 type:complete len:390 (-) Transcript_13568:62-1231(-)